MAKGNKDSPMDESDEVKGKPKKYKLPTSTPQEKEKSEEKSENKLAVVPLGETAKTVAKTAGTAKTTVTYKPPPPKPVEWKAHLAAVNAAYDFTALEKICGMNQDTFQDYIPGLQWWNVTVDAKTGAKQYLYYLNRGSDILAVAHLDSVQSERWAYEIFTPAIHQVHSPVLDDRLGVYIILEMLPKLGVTTDILLCYDEEVGKSTAMHLETVLAHMEAHGTPRPTYKHMVEFDRKGDDVVMYKYEASEYRKMLSDVGFRVGTGIFTDICKLGDLGCMGMNIGVGYDNYHNYNAYADIDEMCENVAKYLEFLKQHGDKHHPHDPTKGGYNYSSNYSKDWTNWKYGGGYSEHDLTGESKTSETVGDNEPDWYGELLKKQRDKEAADKLEWDARGDDEDDTIQATVSTSLIDLMPLESFSDTTRIALEESSYLPSQIIDMGYELDFDSKPPAPDDENYLVYQVWLELYRKEQEAESEEALEYLQDIEARQMTKQAGGSYDTRGLKYEH